MLNGTPIADPFKSSSAFGISYTERWPHSSISSAILSILYYAHIFTHRDPFEVAYCIKKYTNIRYQEGNVIHHTPQSADSKLDIVSTFPSSPRKRNISLANGLSRHHTPYGSANVKSLFSYDFLRANRAPSSSFFNLLVKSVYSYLAPLAAVWHPCSPIASSLR
jgi:hypothetical protein